MKQPYEYRIVGEPTFYAAPANFDRQYELLRVKLEAEHKRSDNIDAKAATLFAGLVAILGFSLGQVKTFPEAAMLLLFAWPVAHLYLAYRTITWKDAPSAREVGEKFPWYPQTTLASAALALADSIEYNMPKIDKKARQLNAGFTALMFVTAIIVVFRVFSFAPGGENVQRVNAAPSAASARGANAAKPNATYTKGRGNQHSPKVTSPRAMAS